VSEPIKELEVPAKKEKPLSPAAYNRKYYLANKAKLARRKAKRYADDPEYKAKILARRKQQREEEKAERKKKRERDGPLPPKHARPPVKRRVLLSGGDSIVTEIYSLGQAAYQVGVSTQTLRKWERIGVLPRADHYSPGGHRQYTKDQVFLIKAVYKKYKEKSDPWRITPDFKAAMALHLGKLDNGVSTEDEDDE